MEFKAGATLLTGFLVLLMIISVVGSVYAQEDTENSGEDSRVTGRIGNARMVLYPALGDEIEKSIRVINSNKDAIDIKLQATGDLADSIELIDEEFRLEPDEEKRARFIITASKLGVTESRINVFFTPTNGKNGIVLPSVIILSTKLGDGSSGGGGDDNGISSTVKYGLAITALIFIALLFVLGFASKKGVKTKSKKSEKSK